MFVTVFVMAAGSSVVDFRGATNYRVRRVVTALERSAGMTVFSMMRRGR